MFQRAICVGGEEPSVVFIRRCAVVQGEGFISSSALRERTGWTEVRAGAALDTLLRQGMAMIDDPPAGERLFWFPCLQISDTASTVSGYSVAQRA